MNNQLLKYLIVLIFIAHSNSIVFGMAAEESVIARAAEEALGADVAKGLEEGAMSAAVKDVAAKMGVSVEEIGRLPEETQQLFKEQLISAFKSGNIEVLEGKIKFNNLDASLNSAREGFAKNISQTLENKVVGPLQQADIEKIAGGYKVNFPEPKLQNLPKGVDVEPQVKSPLEQAANDAESNFQKAQADFDYADKLGDQSLISKSEANLQKALKNLNDAFAKVDVANAVAVEKAQTAVAAAEQKAIEGAGTAENEENLIKAKEDLKTAKQKEAEAKRSQAANKLEQEQTKLDNANERIKTAENDLNELEKKYKNATAEEKANLDKQRMDIRKRLTDTREEVAEYEQSVAKAKSEFQSTKGYWERTKEFGSETAASVRQAFTKEQALANLKSGGKAFAGWGKNKLFGWGENFAAGLAFAASNYVVGPIVESVSLDAAQRQIRHPQRFGGIWMQIPSKLIDEKAPLNSLPIYVGIDTPSNKNTEKRESSADGDSYLKVANYYVPVSDYGEYAKAAITDPNFPGRMVHLNTGFYFISDGLPADNENQTIPFLNANKNARGPLGSSLQSHLDILAGAATHCVHGKTVIQERRVSTGCQGSKVIGDLFDQTKNKQTKYDLPADYQYAQILSSAVDRFAIIAAFGPFKVKAFQAFNADQLKVANQYGTSGGALNYPYVAWSVPPAGFVYQTTDTSDIKRVLGKLPAGDSVANLITDYVIFVDSNEMVPLLIPTGVDSSYGTPSYQINPNTKTIKMISLITGKTYTIDGKFAGITDNKKFFDAIDEKMQGQVAAVQAIYNEKLKSLEKDLIYGPFTVGNAALIADKNWIDKKAYVYKIEKALENGSDDYVVAVGKDASGNTVVSKLPDDSVFAYVSVITSKFYDSQMAPYGYTTKQTTFWVYKQPSGSFVVVTGGKNEENGTPLFSGSAWQYSLFMDPEINPNQLTADQQKILMDNGAKTPDGKPTAAAQFLSIPNQWALSSQGLYADRTKDKEIRLGQYLDTNAPDVRAKIDGVYTTWKNSIVKDKNLANILGPYRFTTDMLRNILLVPTSVADIKNGNYIYQSASLRNPEWFLALADDENGTQNFATEFNLAAPQRYAISLSNGNVYDSQASPISARTAPIKVIADVDSLVKRAQRVPFLPALLKRIQDSQAVHQQNLLQDIYGDNTEFGQFKFYLSPTDLKKGTYVYWQVDRTAGLDKMTEDELLKNEEKLLPEVKNFYMTIEGNLSDKSSWIVGKKISEKTDYVISLVNGSIYDRGGMFVSFLRSFGTGLDTASGFLQTIFQLAQNTWGTEKLSGPVNQAILNLTNPAFEQIDKERDEIEEEEKKEAQNKPQPVNPNIFKNLDAQPYVPELQNLTPMRFLKQSQENKKYYFVSPDEGSGLYQAGQKAVEKSFIDFNVGDAGKDNNLGVIYDAQGNPKVTLSGWGLANMRAYNGLIVGADGSQKIDVAVATDHPIIPIQAMIRLDAAGLQKAVDSARAQLVTAYQAFAKNSTNQATADAYGTALSNYQAMRLANQNAQAAAKAISLSSGANSRIKFDFYFDQAVKMFFAKVTQDGRESYVDLIGGYVFYPDGTPHLATQQVFANQDTKKQDLLFVGKDEIGGFIAAFMDENDKYFVSSLGVCKGSGEATAQSKDGKSVIYSLRSDEDGTCSTIILTYNADGSIQKYDVLMYDRINETYEPLGTYLPSNLVYSLLTYIRTDGAFVDDDRGYSPVQIIWDGSSALNLQKLLYKNNLISLQKSGNKYTGSYMQDGKAMPITLEIKKMAMGNYLSARWVTISEGSKNYDFLFDTKVFSITSPTTCPETQQGVLSENIELLKKCVWRINAVIDSKGQPRLVSNIPSGMPIVTSGMVQGAPKDASTQSEIGITVSKIRHDTQNNRYVYPLSAADAGWSYYTDSLNGWYVDLATGILFDTSTVSAGGYPTSSLLNSQLFTLLDRLGVSVTDVQDASGTPAYDENGKPLGINVRQGLVYRGINPNKTPQ